MAGSSQWYRYAADDVGVVGGGATNLIDVRGLCIEPCLAGPLSDALVDLGGRAMAAGVGDEDVQGSLIGSRCGGHGSLLG